GYVQNNPAFAISLVAAWKAGGAAVVINPMNKRREPAYLLADSGAGALLCLDDLYGSVAREVIATGETAVRTVITCSPLDEQSRNDERLFAGPQRLRPAGTLDLGEIFSQYDGRGCSGLRRRGRAVLYLRDHRRAEGRDVHPRHDGVQRSDLPGLDGIHCRGLRARGSAAVPYHRPDRPRGDRDARGVPAGAQPTVRAACGHRRDPRAPAHVHHRIGHGVHQPLRAGRSDQGGLVLLPDDLLRRCADRARDHRPVHGEDRPLPPQHLRPDRDYLAIARRAPGQEGAGGPELGSAVGGRAGIQHRGPDHRRGGPRSSRRPDWRDRHLGSAGHPRHWNKPDATAESLPGGELRTGDVGFMDEDGWCYLVDRKKDMINAAGRKVWPREAEDVLCGHPAVREAAVVGV